MINATAKSFLFAQTLSVPDADKIASSAMVAMTAMVCKFVIQIASFLSFDPVRLILYTNRNKGYAFMALDEAQVYSGKVLKSLRSGKQWTVRDLSKHSGVSASAISNFEREVRQPQIDILKKLLLALDAPKLLVM